MSCSCSSIVICLTVVDPVCGCDNVTYLNSCEAGSYGVTSWTNGPCSSTDTSSNSCIDPNQIDSSAYCPAVVEPVCGCDNVTYVNSCEAVSYGGVTSWTNGPCSTSTDTSSNSCIDPNQIDSSAYCPAVVEPVCGCDNVTYVNSCEAVSYGGVTSWTNGPCSTSDTSSTNVWPGDANNDGIANNFDLLSVGLHHGETGPNRSNISIDWMAHQAEYWNTNQTNGQDIVYSDCNGSGLIDSVDINAINTNYALTHSKGDSQSNGDIPFKVYLSNDDNTITIEGEDTVFTAGDTVLINVELGNIDTIAQDVYGIAYTINFDNSVISNELFEQSFTNSWLTPDSNNINIMKPFHNQGIIDVAQSRIDQSPQTGYGIINRISVIIEDDLSGKGLKTLLESTISISNVKLISNDGSEISTNNSSSSFSIQPKGTLPIELINFDGEVISQQNIELNWATASEINNDYFIIEYSNDGINFSSIGEVKGNETSSNINKYSFSHNNLNNGEHFYRLRQVDFDGISSTSIIISFIINRELIRTSEFYPNPNSDGKIKIDFVSSTDNPVEIVLYDINGRQVISKIVNNNIGINRISVNVNLLNSGVYFGKLIQKNSEPIYRKIIIK